MEGEPALVAAQQSGQSTALTVQRGDKVKTGTPLFSQDQATEAANVSQAQARLGNLATGKRPPEIAVIAAQLKEARARRSVSAGQLARQQALVAKGFVSAESLDQARAQRERDEANIARMKAQWATDAK